MELGSTGLHGLETVSIGGVLFKDSVKVIAYIYFDFVRGNGK